MNDPTEIDYLRHVGGIVRSVTGKSDFGKRLAEDLIRRVERCQVYVVSFSQTFNNLSQWRAYAPGPTGVALEFDPSHFGATPVLPTTYERRRRASDDSFAERIRAIEREAVLDARAISRQAFIDEVTHDAVLLKPPEYADERESRAFKFSEEPDGFYAGRYGMTPYVRLILPRESLTRVFLNPAADRRSAALGTSLFLKHYGYPNQEAFVFSSEVRN